MAENQSALIGVSGTDQHQRLRIIDLPKGHQHGKKDRGHSMKSPRIASSSTSSGVRGSSSGSSSSRSRFSGSSKSSEKTDLATGAGAPDEFAELEAPPVLEIVRTLRTLVFSVAGHAKNLSGQQERNLPQQAHRNESATGWYVHFAAFVGQTYSRQTLTGKRKQHLIRLSNALTPAQPV